MTNEELIEEIQAGQEEKRNLLRLWERNRGLAQQFARKYAAFADWEELLQEGYIALHKAAYAYDQGRGGGFSTFLYSILPRAFSRYVSRQSVMQLPEGIRRQIGELERMENAFLMEHGRYPTNWEASCLLETTPEQLEKVRRCRLLASMDSLDRPVDQEDGETPLSGSVAAPGDDMEELEEEIYQEGMIVAVWAVVDSLEAEESEVVRRRYVAGQSMKEIGESHGEPPAWARKVEARALRHLGQGRRYRLLLPYWEEIHNAGMKGVGAKRFDETWTSATEREALRLMERRQEGESIS